MTLPSRLAKLRSQFPMLPCPSCGGGHVRIVDHHAGQPEPEQERCARCGATEFLIIAVIPPGI